MEGKKIATGSDEVDPTELWQVRTDGKEATLLVKCRASEKPESVIAAFENLQFSTNGKLVYFVTPAWATSGAVHVVDTTNRKERYLFPGNGLKAVASGEYKDCLLVQQHRYFIGGGSYDWYWLLRPGRQGSRPSRRGHREFRGDLRERIGGSSAPSLGVLFSRLRRITCSSRGGARDPPGVTKAKVRIDSQS